MDKGSSKKSNGFQVNWNHVQEGLRKPLSGRELEVCQAVLQGKKLQEIADATGLALGTIKTYLHRLYRKLNVNSMQELVLTVINLNDAPTSS